MKQHTLDAMSLPRAKSWAAQTGSELSVLDFLSAKASVEICIACAQFFWPRFIEVRGCILLAWTYDPIVFDQWWETLEGDTGKIEKTLNHLHLWDVFSEDGADYESTYNELTRLLSITWVAQAKAQFPDLEFIVECLSEVDEYGPTLTISRRDKSGDNSEG